jgi:hypothetical protein
MNIFDILFKRTKPLEAPEPYGEEGLTRKNIGVFEGGFYPGALIKERHYEYYCKCGTTLTEGPSGGLSVNAVCEKCRINYGCLPGYFGDQ